MKKNLILLLLALGITVIFSQPNPPVLIQTSWTSNNGYCFSHLVFSDTTYVSTNCETREEITGGYTVSQDTVILSYTGTNEQTISKYLHANYQLILVSLQTWTAQSGWGQPQTSFTEDYQIGFATDRYQIGFATDRCRRQSANRC